MESLQIQETPQIRSVNAVIQHCMQVGSAASSKASWIRFSDIMINLLIFFSGSAVGIMSTFDHGSEVDLHIRRATAAFGFLIAMLKALNEVLNLPKRAIALKLVSIQMRKIVRRLIETKKSTVSPQETEQILAQALEEIDNLDMTLFVQANSTVQLSKA